MARPYLAVPVCVCLYVCVCVCVSSLRRQLAAAVESATAAKTPLGLRAAAKPRALPIGARLSSGLIYEPEEERASFCSFWAAMFCGAGRPATWRPSMAVRAWTSQIVGATRNQLHERANEIKRPLARRFYQAPFIYVSEWRLWLALSMIPRGVESDREESAR